MSLVEKLKKQPNIPQVKIFVNQCHYDLTSCRKNILHCKFSETPVTYLLEQTQSDIQKITNFVPETTVTNINFSVKNKPLLLTWKVLGCNRTSTRE